MAYAEQSWYRIQLLAFVDNDSEVMLVDHGKKTVVSTDDIKDLPPKFKKLPFQVSHFVASQQFQKNTIQ